MNIQQTLTVPLQDLRRQLMYIKRAGELKP